MKWWIGPALILAAAGGANAQPVPGADWTRLPPKQLLFSEDALKWSYKDIEAMRPNEIEALTRMLAACSNLWISKNEVVTAECDRSAEYLEIIYTRGVALLDILKAMRLHWSIWRRHTGAVGDAGKELSRMVDIEMNWKASIRLRSMKEDRERRP